MKFRSRIGKILGYSLVVLIPAIAFAFTKTIGWCPDHWTSASRSYGRRFEITPLPTNLPNAVRRTRSAFPIEFVGGQPQGIGPRLATPGVSWSNYGPAIVSERSRCASGSHPRRVVSVSYEPKRLRSTIVSEESETGREARNLKNAGDAIRCFLP